MKAGVVYILIYVSGCDPTSVRGTQRLFSVKYLLGGANIA